MNKTYIFHFKEGVLREKATMDLPDMDKYIQFDGAGVKNYDRAGFRNDMEHYRKHLASLKSFPVSDELAELLKDAEEYNPGEHFHIANLSNDCKCIHCEIMRKAGSRYIAIPLPVDIPVQDSKWDKMNKSFDNALVGMKKGDFEKLQTNTQPQDKDSEGMKYNSPYPSEVTYRCDKNFLVRLKAFLDRNMREVGYKTSGDIFHNLLEKLNDAEDYFFESKVKTPTPVKESSLNTIEPVEEDMEDKRIMEEAMVSAMIMDWFHNWCKNSKRGGGILIVTSLKDLLTDFYNHIKNEKAGN